MGPPIAPRTPVRHNSLFGPNYAQGFSQPAFVPPNQQLTPQQQFQEQNELQAKRQFVPHQQQQQQFQQQQQQYMRFQPEQHNFVRGPFYSQQPAVAPQQNFQQQHGVQHQSHHMQTIPTNYGSQVQGHISASDVYQSLLQTTQQPQPTLPIPHQHPPQHQHNLQQQVLFHQKQQRQRLLMEHQRQQMLLRHNHQQQQQQQQIQQQQQRMLQQTLSSQQLSENSRVEASLVRSSAEVCVPPVQPDHQNRSQGQIAQCDPASLLRSSAGVSVRLMQSNHPNRSQGLTMQRDQVSPGLALQTSTATLTRQFRNSAESPPLRSQDFPTLPRGVTLERVQVSTRRPESSSDCATAEHTQSRSLTVETSAQPPSDDLTTPQCSPSDDSTPFKQAQDDQSSLISSNPTNQSNREPQSSHGAQADIVKKSFDDHVFDAMAELFSRKFYFW